jgi:hypothetical protein
VTNQEASQVVFMLFAAFPQSEGKQSEERLQLYKQMLLDLDFSEAKAAVIRVIQGSKFLPTIAEIRAAARDLRTGLRRTGMEAWGDVINAIRYVGSYRSPRFEDQRVAKVVECMGWQELCLGDNESSLRARFIEAYEAISDREFHEQAISEPLRLKQAPGMALLSQSFRPLLEADTFDVGQFDDIPSGKNRRLS